MNLITQITSFLNRFSRNNPETTADDTRRRQSSGTRARLGKLQLSRARQDIVRDCRRMYEEDPRAGGIIETLARDAVKGGFEIVVADSPQAEQAQTLVDELVKRLKLTKRMDDWTRLSLRDGDTFLELGVDRSRLVQLITRKPTLEMNRHANMYDRFDDPARAYWWSDFPISVPADDVLWFADWQIVHARWAHDEGSRYGKPLFAAARKAFRRMEKGEDDIYIRRATRAGMKYIHIIEGDEGDIDQYRLENQDVLNNPLAAIADFFTNKETAIKTVQGDARLSEIGDVLHHIETWAVASPVPLALLGYGKDLNRDILEQKLEQYERALEPVTDWVTDQLLIPLLERQWLLQGIWPDDLDYSINWASKKVLTAEALAAVGEAGLKLKGLGWPDEIIARVLVPLIPGLTIEDLTDAMAKAQANKPDEIDRIANEAARHLENVKWGGE